jgi:uridine kinase
MTGIRSHHISLDFFLKPPEARHEGVGVENRYDMNAIHLLLNKVATCSTHFNITLSKSQIPINGISRDGESFSIGPKDIVIFEGVPALLDKRFINLSNLKIHIDIESEVRNKRIISEYTRRGYNNFQIEKIINSRDIDEVLPVSAAAVNADHRLNFQ